MPLSNGKGPKAFGSNVKTEMDAGKPQKQAVAIAYAVKRHQMKKKAHGGTVESLYNDKEGYEEGGEVMEPDMDMTESTMDHVEEEPSQYSEDFLSHDGEQEAFPEVEYSLEEGPSELPEEDNNTKVRKAMNTVRLNRLNKREG